MIHAFLKYNLESIQAQIAPGDLSSPHQSYKSCVQSPAQSRSGGSSPEEGHRGMRKRICHTCDQPKVESSREKSLQDTTAERYREREGSIIPRIALPLFLVHERYGNSPMNRSNGIILWFMDLPVFFCVPHLQFANFPFGGLSRYATTPV